MEVPQQSRSRSSSSARDKNQGINPAEIMNSTATIYHGQPSPLLDPMIPTSTLSQPSSLFPDPTSLTSTADVYGIDSSFVHGTAGIDESMLHSNLPTDPSFNLAQPFAQSFETSFLQQLEQNSSLKANQGTTNNPSNLLPTDQMPFEDFGIYQSNSQTDYTALLDPHGSQTSPHLNQSINPADLSRMSSPHNPTPPHLAPPESHTSPRPASPISSPGTHYTPSHSRHTSLDPATAAYVTGHGHSDWHGMIGNPSFQTHRRAPSEHSDVSSVAPSPYIAQEASFDTENNPSPLLMAQNDLCDNALGIASFTISDTDHAFSPAHSPYNMSPRIMPQQTGGDLGIENAYLSPEALNNAFPQFPLDTYNLSNDISSGLTLPSQTSPCEIGQATRMTPPVISVEFAPPSRTSTFETGNKPGVSKDTLSPPINRRGRSKSDTFAQTMPRSLSASAIGTPFPSLTPDPRSLSPLPRGAGSLSTPASREASPAAKNRRQSTSSIDSRNYILELADPQRSGSNVNDSKRVQKHPATFQCHLCTKRFTRAYNLRSHLRTHTDERPFVCTVCGKAFARQHDRKRHEGLHSGEKRFVCRGDLGRGGQWGCGRRFARADALGRHFRSEAGRVCIKPLLDEEALEREQPYYPPQDQQQPQQQVTGHLQPIPQPVTIQGIDNQHSTFTLPAALLAQYPALQTLQWDQLPTQPDDTDFGSTGRRSFDASSGAGEFGFNDDDESGLGSGYVSAQGPSPSHSPHDQLLGVSPSGVSWQPHAAGWAGDFDGTNK